MMKLFLLFMTSLCFARPITILALGDSLTEGYGVAREEAYPAQLEKLLLKEGKDIKVINAGLSGATTASGANRLKWYFRAKPQLMILSLGANDGLRGVKLDSTLQNLEKIITSAHKEKIKIILAGMKLPPNYGKKYTKDFEDIYEKLAKKHKLTLIPFLLKGIGGEKDLNLADGIHPNEKGHKIMAKNVYPFIIKELESITKHD